MGGGTGHLVPGCPLNRGLSPRGRGNHLLSTFPYHGKGSIPAWAGEPSWPSAWSSVAQVYPRVGGGTPSAHGGTGPYTGLSPRGRGNHTVQSLFGMVTGSIPAWAGEPRMPATPSKLVAVYPRVGGGTLLCFVAHSVKCGLSPRGRGNLLLWAGWFPNFGSIPAWAGEPRSGSLAARM